MVDTHRVGLISVRVYTPDAVPDLVAASSLEPGAACNAICSLFNSFCLVANKLPEVQQASILSRGLTFGVYLMATLKHPAEQLTLS